MNGMLIINIKYQVYSLIFMFWTLMDSFKINYFGNHLL